MGKDEGKGDKTASGYTKEQINYWEQTGGGDAKRLARNLRKEDLKEKTKKIEKGREKE